MRRVDVHFSCGWDFLDDYKLLLGALIVPVKDMRIGEAVELCCRFANDERIYRWPATVERVGLRTVNGEHGVLLQFPEPLRAEVEETAWAFARGERKRSEVRIEPPTNLELIVRHKDIEDSTRVVARDISPSGCKLECDDQSFEKDEPVVITWTKGRTTGRVKWADGALFGVSFDVPIDDLHGLLAADVS